MPAERKSTMVSLRLPLTLVARVDFVSRNIDSDALDSRSAVIYAAIEAWLPTQEERLEKLGIIPKKAPR